MEFQIWECSNQDCGKTFPLAARITQRKKVKVVYSDVTEKTVEFFCCPYCQSKEFKPIVIVIEAGKG